MSSNAGQDEAIDAKAGEGFQYDSLVVLQHNSKQIAKFPPYSFSLRLVFVPENVNNYFTRISCIGEYAVSSFDSCPCSGRRRFTQRELG